MINYPVKYNKDNGSIDDSFGHVLAIVNWFGRARFTTQDNIDQSATELVDLINAGRINLNSISTSTENSGSIDKAINFVRKKFINERGEIVEAKGRPKKNWKPLSDKEVRELENANI